MHPQGEGIITWIQDGLGKPFAALGLASKDLVSPPAFPDVDAMSDARWGRATDYMLEQVPGAGLHRGRLQGFSGVFLSLDGFLFAWGRGQDPAAALRALAEKTTQDGEVIPWPMTGGLCAAVQAWCRGHLREQLQSVVRCFLQAVPSELMPEEAAAPIPPRREIERSARNWDGRPGSVPVNVYARARFLWEAGRRLVWLAEEMA
jgi:hypothetical protein